jgi:hypothetical protein
VLAGRQRTRTKVMSRRPHGVVVCTLSTWHFQRTPDRPVFGLMVVIVDVVADDARAGDLLQWQSSRSCDLLGGPILDDARQSLCCIPGLLRGRPTNGLRNAEHLKILASPRGVVAILTSNRSRAVLRRAQPADWSTNGSVQSSPTATIKTIEGGAWSRGTAGSRCRQAPCRPFVGRSQGAG